MAPAKTARLLFAGGGTGGHLYPAIAIANRITELLEGKRQVEIAFVGTKRGLEYRIKDSLGYPLHLINVRGLARRLTLSNLLVPFVLIQALFKAATLLNKLKPDVVVGTGGYVALPVLKMAAVKRIPTVLQEQNSYPGITTRKLAWAARSIYLGFEGALSLLKTNGKVTVTGNPVRRNIADFDRNEALKQFGLDATKKTILVMGGSLGARAVNNAVLKSLKEGSLGEDYQLLWQTGRLNYDKIRSEAGGMLVESALIPFADDMAAVYAAADIAVARAGAISLAEIEACALPSVLIPYPYAAGDHQSKNAEDFSKLGFAEVVDERELDDVDVLSRAVTLLDSGEADRMREEMKEANIGRRPAVDIIAEDIIGLIEKEDLTGDSGGHR